jgi:hypothetical protein
LPCITSAIFKDSVASEKKTLFHYKEQMVNAVSGISAVCSENHMKLTNIIWGRNSELHIVQADGTYIMGTVL